MAAATQIPIQESPAPNPDLKFGHRINIGCGISGIAGWHNLDNSPTILLSRIPVVRRLSRIPNWPRDVRRVDVRKGLPFEDQSATCIYSSHTFEHFTWEESLAITKECFRVLKSEGVLRIVVPDLRLIVGEYLRNQMPKASHEFLRRLSLTHDVFDFLHPGTNHSQMFDENSLAHLFREAGFRNPEVCGYLQSRIPDISSVELEARRRESLYMEAEA